jgi:hypothetical protein
MRKENKKERVLARMLAEEELKSTQGADQTVVYTWGALGCDRYPTMATSRTSKNR